MEGCLQFCLSWNADPLDHVISCALARVSKNGGREMRSSLKSINDVERHASLYFVVYDKSHTIRSQSWHWQGDSYREGCSKCLPQGSLCRPTQVEPSIDTWSELRPISRFKSQIKTMLSIGQIPRHQDTSSYCKGCRSPFVFKHSSVPPCPLDVKLPTNGVCPICQEQEINLNLVKPCFWSTRPPSARRPFNVLSH